MMRAIERGADFGAAVDRYTHTSRLTYPVEARTFSVRGPVVAKDSR
jgi:hypothetical protein